MADRTVSVRLRMSVQDFMRNGAAASAAVSRLSGQLEALDGKRVQPKIDIDVDRNRVRQAMAGIAGAATGEAARHSPGIFRAMFTPNPAVLRTLRTGIPAALSSPIGVAGLALGGVFAASFAAAVISAGLFAGLGAGFTGLAAVVLRENERVRLSFDQMVDTVQADLVEAAQPLVPVFDQALSRVGQMFGPRIADPLEDIFEGLAPTIVPFAESAVDTVGNLLDELATPEFLADMETILGAITDEMPRLGQDIGDFFATIGENSDDIAESFGHVITVLDGILGAGAATINFLTDGLNELADTIGPVVDGYQELDFWIKKISGGEDRDTGPVAVWENIGEDLTKIGDGLRDLGVPEWLLFTDAADGAGKAASRSGGDIAKMAAATDRSGDAALTAAAQLEDYKERAEALGQELRLLSGLRRDSIRAGLDVQQAAADASRALVDAEGAVADARSAAGDAARDAADAERQAQQRIADAQERVTDARESAARAAEQAAERVTDAEGRLADTQDRAREAQQGLTQARRDAAQALRDMREQVSDLALAEESAELGLIDARRRLEEERDADGSREIERAQMSLANARQRLADVTDDSAASDRDKRLVQLEVLGAEQRLQAAQERAQELALERRKAELGVLQAEDQLSDVRRDQTEATKDLNEAERRGIEGSEQVVEAKERITEANEAVRDAQEDVRDAIRDERRTQEDSAEAIRDAIAGVDEARRNAARTAEESAARIADAARRVREAEEEANLVREQVRERMLDIADAAEAEALALFEETGQQDLATEALERGRDELIKAGVQYGLTRKDAKDYADQILGTPDEWTTIFKSKGLDNVKNKVADLEKQILELDDKTIVITADGKARIQGELGGHHLRAHGGPIDGPGTSSSDSIPVWASDGEYMMRAAARRKYGDDVMDAINSGQLAIGGPDSNTVRVHGKDNINAADFGLMATHIAAMAAEASFSSGKVLPPGSYRIGRGTAGHGYPALDLPAPIGTPIYSMAAGMVSRAMRLGTSYGIHAFVNHPGDRQSRYAHMSSMNVGVGDEVRKGQLLGRVGSTGNSTGPHLHFEHLIAGMRRDPKQLGIFHGGGPTDDGIGVLRRGEFVVQAPAVQSLGMDAMRQINQGRVPGGGGMTVNGPLIGEVKTLSGDRFSLPELENDLRFAGAA